MREGLYKVGFRTPLGYGAGVVVLQNGIIRGGDFAMYYVGTYSLRDGEFSAVVEIAPHSTVPSDISVLGTTRGTLNLKGTYTAEAAKAEGVSPQAPGITFSAELTRLSD